VAALTQKQADMLRMISRHIRRYGYSPSVREIAEKTGRSTTAAHIMIKQLEKRGAIRRTEHRDRAIEVVT